MSEISFPSLASLSHPAPSSDEIARRLVSFAEAARGAYADNTTRALRADAAVFMAWCRENGRVPLPSTAETLAAFVDAMAGTRKSATVRRYVAVLCIVGLGRGAHHAYPTLRTE